MCRVDRVKDVLADTPEAKGRLIIDLSNEPDGYTLTWEVNALALFFTSHGCSGYKLCFAFWLDKGCSQSDADKGNSYLLCITMFLWLGVWHFRRARLKCSWHKEKLLR